MKRKPGRPPLYANEPVVQCFVCDGNIQRSKADLILGPSNSELGFPSQISQLIGDEFIVIVKKDDYLCKQCVSLFNSMDKFEKHLMEVKYILLGYLKKKYSLLDGPVHDGKKESVSSDTEEEVDDSENEIALKLTDLHSSKNSVLKCKICTFCVADQDEFDKHVRNHIKVATKTEEDDLMNLSSRREFAAKRFKCSICSKVYSSKESCMAHMKFTHLPPGWEEGNGRRIDQRYNLLQEKGENVHKLKKQLFFCELCRVNFDDEHKLSAHKCGSVRNDIKTECSTLAEINMNLSKEVNLTAKQSSGNRRTAGIDNENFSIPNVGSKFFSQSDVYNYNDCDSEKENSPNRSRNESDLSESFSEDEEAEGANVKKYACSNCGFKSSLGSLKEHLLEIRPQRDLVCSVCGQSFNSFCKLISHSSGHDIDSDPVECVHCDAKVPDLLSLDYHMKKNHLHLLGYKTCEICGVSFPGLEFLKRHQKLKHDNVEDEVPKDEVFKEVADKHHPSENTILDGEFEENHEFLQPKLMSPSQTEENDVVESMNVIYSCGICGEERTEKEDLLKHFESHNDESLCEICNINLLEPERLRRHRLGHPSKTQEVLCIYCGDKLHDRLHLMYHMMKIHTNLSKKYCDSCEMQFSSLKKFNQHIFKIHRPKFSKNEYKCNKCEKGYKTKYRLYRHYSYVHREIKKCRYCKKIVGSPKKLYSHELSHKRKYFNSICEVCGAFCKTDTDTARHKLRHRGLSFSYCCEICIVSFPNAELLDTHMKIHAFGINYGCDICSKTFLSYACYELHRKAHEKASSYSCNMCFFQFKTTSLRAQHKRKFHKGKFVLKCKFCTSTFVVNSSNILKQHLYKHVRNLPYYCKFCLRDFTTRNRLVQHVTRIHKNNFSLASRIYLDDRYSSKHRVVSNSNNFQRECENKKILNIDEAIS